jgi:hypothetical protein
MVQYSVSSCNLKGRMRTLKINLVNECKNLETAYCTQWDFTAHSL